MKFNGFSSIGEYERECARLGYKTERVPFYCDGEEYFALVTSPPGFQTSGTAVRSWHLFTADESAELLDGIISGGATMHADPEIINGVLEPGYMQNGMDVNWLGKLASHGFFPAESAGEISAA